MVTGKERKLIEFASRLNRALDEIGFPPKGRGRQVELAKRMSVSQKGARKWLEGESFPTTDKLMELAALTKCSFELLVIGQDDAYKSQSQYQLLQSGIAESPARTAFRPIIEWDKPEDLPEGQYVFVRRVRVRFSAGNGQQIFEEEEGEPLAFTTRWIKNRGLCGSQLVLVSATGDSMEPAIRDGNLMLIDRAQTDVQEGNVFALRYGDELRVKRLYPRYDGGLTLRSDNAAKYPDEIVPASDLSHIQIFGRVVWSAGEM